MGSGEPTKIKFSTPLSAQLLNDRLRYSIRINPIKVIIIFHRGIRIGLDCKIRAFGD